MGDFQPGEKPGILSERGRMLRVLRAHPRTESIFVAQTPELAGNVARFELILDYDPFSLDAVRVVDRVEEELEALSREPGGFWSHAGFALSGTTAAIRDLREVTRRDNLRIQLQIQFHLWRNFTVFNVKTGRQHHFGGLAPFTDKAAAIGTDHQIKLARG